MVSRYGNLSNRNKVKNSKFSNFKKCPEFGSHFIDMVQSNI